MNEYWKMIDAKREAMKKCGFEELAKTAEKFLVRSWDINVTLKGDLKYDFMVDVKRNGSWSKNQHIVCFMYSSDAKSDRIKLLEKASKTNRDLMDICFEEVHGCDLPEIPEQSPEQDWSFIHENERFTGFSSASGGFLSAMKTAFDTAYYGIYTSTNEKENKMDYTIYEYTIVDRRNAEVVDRDIIIIDPNVAVGKETLILMQAGISANGAQYMKVFTNAVGGFEKFPEGE